MGQVMLGIFAAYQLGKQISKIRLSTSTATLLSKTSQNSPAKPASDPHPNGTDYLVCSQQDDVKFVALLNPKRGTKHVFFPDPYNILVY